ncbi:MAG: neutral zinc metallopeptidase [Bacteroidota bacterium]
MRLGRSRRSTNVVDARGRAGGPGRKAAIGCGPLLIVGLLALVFGADPSQVLQLLGESGQSTAQVEPGASGAPQDQAGDFIAAVLGETEDVWREVYPAATGQPYREARLVLFERVYPTACGTGTAATGPFYCPLDETVYLDLSFFNQLARMGGQGDFAAAYVVAHEVGHHVQHLTGVLGQTQRFRNDSRVSVAVELQADCYAGVWAHHADRQRDVLDESDIQEGMNAAAAVGDDAIRGGAVRKDDLSHGTSEMRVSWFLRGFRSGDMRACDTFG